MTIDEKLDLLLCKSDKIEKDVAVLKEDVTLLKEDVTLLKKDVAVLKEDVTLLKEDVAVLKEDVAVLKEDVCTLKEKTYNLSENMLTLQEDMHELKLVVENEVCVGLSRVAEGHIDIMRNFQQAMKPSTEMELMMIRVGRLESEMREIKRKVS